ncbi:MAG: radical SAM protein [Elusimicrobia bacterium]|nr:radical SAM protein [Elusimicrobiota bacterium]
MRIDSFRAPLAVAWQLTRRCDLACVHCLTESGPHCCGPEELSKEDCLRIARECVACGIPYVILTGGEPALSPHFLDLAETLGRGGVWLKVETNGQRFGPAAAERLAKLPIRSVQVSIDGAAQGPYARLRPGADLQAALDACRTVRRLGMPLEVTFVPTAFNLGEAKAVIDLAVDLGAFRFNTGRLIRMGRADRRWEGLSPSQDEYQILYSILLRKEAELAGRMELCFRPFSAEEQALQEACEPSGTLVVLPDGKVLAAALSDQVCADLRHESLTEAWAAYRRVRRDPGSKKNGFAAGRKPAVARSGDGAR